MKKIVKSFLFENNLIISLSKEWLEIFGKIIDFEYYVDNQNHLVIKSIEPFFRK